MTTNQYIAAIDQGTSSTRCIIVNKYGDFVGSAQKTHRQIYSQPGWVEHDPIEIWENTQEVIKNAIDQSSIDPKNIASLGITNQRETTLIWDSTTGHPLNNAIVWQDTRTKEICDRLIRHNGIDNFRDITGLPIATYFSGPKIEWLIENNPKIQKLLNNPNQIIVGTIDTWLIWWLTGGINGGAHVIDVTNASRTMLMNIKTLDWDGDILNELRIPKSILPKIVPSSTIDGYGMTRLNGPFSAEIPICGDLGDQQAALFGQTCFQFGDIKNTYGTGCFLLMNTGETPMFSKSGLITTVAYQLSNQKPIYAIEGSIAISGALVQWLRDNLGLISQSDDIESLALSVKDNGDVYIVPAFSGLYAPRWRSDARGIIAGLTRHSNKGHLARAVLEATAFQTKEVVEAMELDSGIKPIALKVDGGMVKNNLLMQFQSDILGLPIIRPKILETTALGAAYAAGLAINYWGNFEELRANWHIGYSWTPTWNKEKRSIYFKKWQMAVERSLGWVDS